MLGAGCHHWFLDVLNVSVGCLERHCILQKEKTRFTQHATNTVQHRTDIVLAQRQRRSHQCVSVP